MQSNGMECNDLKRLNLAFVDNDQELEFVELNQRSRIRVTVVGMCCNAGRAMNKECNRSMYLYPVSMSSFKM
jgi:hypothetical protein